MGVLSHFSQVWLFVTLWTITRQPPLSMKYFRQEHWSGFPCFPPGHLPNLGIEPGSPALQADSLPLSHQGSSNRENGHEIVSSAQGGLRLHCEVLKLPSHDLDKKSFVPRAAPGALGCQVVVLGSPDGCCSLCRLSLVCWQVRAPSWEPCLGYVPLLRNKGRRRERSAQLDGGGGGDRSRWDGAASP